MKNIIKIISIFLLVLTYSCEDSNDVRFRSDPTTGWVEFVSSQTSTGVSSASITIPVDINVPVYADGLVISYSLSAVSGDFTQHVSSSNGTIFVDPLDYTRDASIELPLVNMLAARDEVVFDVIISGVDASGVRIGVDDSSIIAHRVTLPCKNDPVLPDDIFLGDYALTIPTGPGAFGVAIFDDQTVSLTVGSNGSLSRQFDVASYLPAFGGPPITISFNLDQDNNLVYIDATFIPFGCASAIYVGGNSSSLEEIPCASNPIYLNMLDFLEGTGDCGVADVPFQVLLTKL